MYIRKRYCSIYAQTSRGCPLSGLTEGQRGHSVCGLGLSSWRTAGERELKIDYGNGQIKDTCITQIAVKTYDS